MHKMNVIGHHYSPLALKTICECNTFSKFTGNAF